MGNKTKSSPNNYDNLDYKIVSLKLVTNPLQIYRPVNHKALEGYISFDLLINKE
jgi:hypothetical protein